MCFFYRNKPYLKQQQTIDLHGLHADEAVKACHNFIDNAYNGNNIITHMNYLFVLFRFLLIYDLQNIKGRLNLP